LLKILADENIPKKLATFLRQYGIDIIRLQLKASPFKAGMKYL